MSNHDDRDGAAFSLVKRFVRDPERFLHSDSSRATPLGQVWCRCADTTHTVHRPRECGQDRFSNDGLCRDCYALLFGSTTTGI